jgi:hypothetical protein
MVGKIPADPVRMSEKLDFGANKLFGSQGQHPVIR